MYYQALAEELMAMRSCGPRLQVERKFSQMLQGEAFVLNFLYEHDEFAHPKELSSAMAVSTARIARLLGELERLDLIERSPDPYDSRQIMVTLTELGEDNVNQNRREALDFMSALLEKFGPDDAAEYVRLNRKFVEIVSEELNL